MIDFYDILELFIEKTSDAPKKVSVKEMSDKKSGFGNYNIAVKAIMESDMSDCYKSEAMKIIDKNKTDAYYEAIVSIVKSTMTSFRKCEAIENLNF